MSNIPQRFIWNKKTDNLISIQKKLKCLIGKKVESKFNIECPLIIFECGEIEEMEIDAFNGIGFPEFNYNGELNYKIKVIPMWGFATKYGLVDLNGCTLSKNYKFMIPREGVLNSDLIKNKIMYDVNHPFVFYV